MKPSQPTFHEKNVCLNAYCILIESISKSLHSPYSVVCKIHLDIPFGRFILTLFIFLVYLNDGRV